jgi:hypothetical protein
MLFKVASYPKYFVMLPCNHKNSVAKFTGAVYNKNMLRRLLVRLTDRLPSKVIQHEGLPVLERYHIWEFSRRGPGIVIHRFVNSDPDRGLHDHPWRYSMSLILAGGYYELLKRQNNNVFRRWLGAGRFNLLDGKEHHRVILKEGGDAWTLFFYGVRTKKWGFLNEKSGDYKFHSEKQELEDDGWHERAPLGKELRQKGTASVQP